MTQVLIIILALLVSNGDKITVGEVYEERVLAADHWYYGENWQFEDGSFVRTIDEETISGCTPFMLCSWIDIDTPWEDILESEDAEVMYKLVRFYQTYRDAMSIFH